MLNKSRQVLRTLPSGHTPAVSSTAARLPRTATTTFKRDAATAAAQPPSPNDPFANGTNAYYAEEMYKHWREDPKSVHVSWDVYFSGMDKGLSSAQAFQPPPRLNTVPVDGAPALHSRGGELDDHLKVLRFFRLPSRASLTRFKLLGSTSCSCISSSRTPCRRA